MTWGKRAICISIVTRTKKLYEATVTYINGDGSEDDEFRIQVDRDSEIQ